MPKIDNDDQVSGGSPSPDGVPRWALDEFAQSDGGVEAQQVLRDWAERLRKQVDPSTTEYRKRIRDAVGVLKSVRESITWLYKIEIMNKRKDRRDSPRPSIWAWPNERQLEEWCRSDDYDLINLDEALAAYLKRPWLQSDDIDLSVINAILFHQLSLILFEIKSGRALGKPNWGYILGGSLMGCSNVFVQQTVGLSVGFIGWLVNWVALPAGAVALAYYGHYEGAEITAAIFGLYLLYRLFTIPARLRWRKAQKKAGETAVALYNALMKAWLAARGSTVNPTQIKALVLAEARVSLLGAA